MAKRRVDPRVQSADIVFGFQVSCGSVGSLPSARPLALSSCVPLAILCSNTLTFWDPDTHYFDALILLYYGTHVLTTLMLQYACILGPRLGSRHSKSLSKYSFQLFNPWYNPKADTRKYPQWRKEMANQEFLNHVSNCPESGPQINWKTSVWC